MSMFYNGAICDIYIGKGAGKKLLTDIANAKKSIKIISPYLSPLLVSELIKFSNRNLSVELITSDKIEDFYGNSEKIIRKLIVQNQEIDNLAVEKRKKWNDTANILSYIGLSLFTMLIGIAYHYKDIKVAFGLLPVIVIFLFIRIYKTKAKNKRIYSYRYSQLFPFKVYMSPVKTALRSFLIHSKIYLIDDKIAYMGSLNFTTNGTKHNYETRIRTEDLKAVKEIKNEIYRLMNYSHLPEKDIQLWGKQLYPEPIN